MGSAPTRIMYLMDHFYSPQGGTEGQLLQLIRGLDRNRFDPCLAVFRPTQYLSEHSLECPVHVLNIGKLFHWSTVIQAFRLNRLIRHSNVQLVHILFNDAAVLAPPFCKMGGAKVVVSRRDMGFWYNSWNLAALRVSNLFVNRFVANSETVKENVSRREGCPIERGLVIYNGHHLARFDVPASAEFRRQHGIGAKDPIIGMIANLYSIKRQADLLRAFEIICRKVANAYLVFAGEGSEEAVLRGIAYSLGLERQVLFLGRVTDIIPIVKHFSVGILCSESEGLSNSIIEYMASGVPTVCTKVGGNVELIVNGQNGFLIEVGDVEGMANQIVRLLRDPTLASELGKSARTRAMSMFSAEKMVNAYMDLYEGLISEARE